MQNLKILSIRPFIINRKQKQEKNQFQNFVLIGIRNF